jgi:hypothetical protein
VTTDEISEKYLKKAIGEINELADEIARRVPPQVPPPGR